MYEKRLRGGGITDGAVAGEHGEWRWNALVNEAVQFADDSPHPELDELYKDVYADKYPLEK